MFVLAGGWYVLLRDDSVGSAAKTAPAPAPAVVSTPKQVRDILTATAKQTRTKVIVKSIDATSTRLVDTAERVVERSLYDNVHYRFLQLDDDFYSYDDGRSCYLHAKQPWSVPVSNFTSKFLPAGRSGLTYKVSGGKTTVVWSFAPDGKTRPTATGTVIADSDTHLMLSASGSGTGIFETSVITYGAAVAVPGKPGNLCKSRG